MAIPFQGIAQGINLVGNVVNNICKSLDDIFNYINPLSDKFILKDVLTFFSNLLDHLNPFSENFILKDVLNVLNYLNPFGVNFFGNKIIELFKKLFEDIFVPSYDHFSDFNQIFEEKFGFISQIKELVTQLFSFRDTVESEIPPSFNITYMGVTVSIIDFSILARFRTTLHAIICAVLWVPFLLRLLKRLPAIIDGFEGNY